MMFRSFCLATCAATLGLGGCTATVAQDAPQTAAAPVAASEQRAKNVILFIGDGMGISTVTAARIYAGQKQGQTGEEYVLPFENFDHVALVKTYNSNAQVPDSAGTASAMNTGVKTNIGMLGYGPGATLGDCASGKGNEVPLVSEEAHDKGKALGILCAQCQPELGGRFGNSRRPARPRLYGYRPPTRRDAIRRRARRRERGFLR